MNRAALERDMRERVFSPRPGPERIGAEIELLVLDAESHAPVPVCDPERRSSVPLPLPPNNTSRTFTISLLLQALHRDAASG